MDLFGLHISTGQVWMLGCAGWLISSLITYKIGKWNAGSARYHAAADRFRKEIHALIPSAPEPGTIHLLASYSPDIVGVFLTPLQKHVDDFLPFLNAKRQSELLAALEAVDTFARAKRQRTGDRHPFRDSDAKTELKKMTKALALFAPEDRSWF